MLLAAGSASTAMGEVAPKASQTHAEPREATLVQEAPRPSGSRSKRSVFASVDLQAAASAGPDGITYDGTLTVVAIGPHCEGEHVSFSSSSVVRGVPSIGAEPAVVIISHRYCVQVSTEAPPIELVGRSWGLRRAPLAEFLNGEQYSSPDPEDLQAAGASLYVPGERGEGRQVGVFVLAGILELPDGSEQTFNALAAAAVVRTDTEFEEQRLFVTLRSSDGTPVNLMAPAPAVR